MKLKLLSLLVICSGLSANQVILQPQEYTSAEKVQYNIRSEDPHNDAIELVDFDLLDPNEKLDPASLNPPLLVAYILKAVNAITPPVVALWNKIYKWFRVHSSARELKVR